MPSVRKRRWSKIKGWLGFCPFIGLGILVTVILMTTKDRNNPDGSCTHPIIRTFDTEKEYYSAIKDGSPISTLHYIPIYHNSGFCLDGSKPAFYYRPGTNKATTKYHIYFEGDGFCFDYETCAKRSQYTFGSSQSYKRYAWFNTQYLSTNKAMNKLSYDWNTIYVRYCDGMAYLANKKMITVFDKKRIHFEGFQILRNLLYYLFMQRNEFDLNTATDIIISASSSGGLAMLYHANHVWNQYIHNLKLKNQHFKFMILIESGYFRMVHENSAKHLLWLYQKMDVSESLNQRCVEYYTESNVCHVDGNCVDDAEQKIYLCLFLEHLMPFIDQDIKIFLMQSRFDFHYSNKNKQTLIETYNKMGDEYTAYIMNEFLSVDDKDNKRMNRGAFITSCKHHCGEFNNIEIDEYVVSEAMFEFYYAEQNRTNRNLWFQNYTYPCKHCCFIESFSAHDPAPVYGCEISE